MKINFGLVAYASTRRLGTMSVQPCRLFLRHLLADLQQHMRARFLQCSAGPADLIDLLIDLLLAQMVPLRQLFQD